VLYADGTINQGMVILNVIFFVKAVGSTRYFENIRYILTLYIKFSKDPTADFTIFAKGYGNLTNMTSDPERNKILSLNNFNHTRESRVT
jgi:hypothetical protein